jgi:hypothetical protein
MKPALALGPVHWKGQLVGRIRKFDGRGLLLDAHVRDSVPPCTRITGFLLGIRGVEDFGKIRRFPIVK